MSSNDDTITVLDLDVMFGSGQTYACTVRPDMGDVLEETPEAIVITFAPRIYQDGKGNDVEPTRYGETVSIQRSQVAMLSKRQRLLKKPAKNPLDALKASGKENR